MAKTTAKKSQTAGEQIAEHFARLAELFGGGQVTAGEPDDDEADDDEEEELETPDREEIEALGIKDLRERAKVYGITASKKADILAEFEELYDEDEDDEDEDDEDEAEFDRDELEEKSLKELRAIAKENGHSAADVKNKDQEELIDLIMGEEDEDDEDDEDEDEEDDDEETLDEDDLKAMSHKELLALAKELEIKVPAAVKKSTKANQKKLVGLILDSGEEE